MANPQEIAQLAVQLVLQDEAFVRGLGNAAGKTNQFAKTMGSLSQTLTNTVSRAFKIATASVTAFGVASTVVGIKFEQAITRVAAISLDGWENLDQLEKKARELGSTTEFTATQSAEAMLEFARAGLTTREILDASAPALFLAGAAGADMALATRSMSAALRQFNIDSSESTRVADVFTTVLRSSLFDLTGLNDAMKYAGTTGASFGFTIEETTAAVAQFRNLGLEASQAGTNFRMSMISSARATEKKTKVLEKYGLVMADINPETHTFAEIMHTLAGTALGATEAIELFGARAGGATNVIIQRFRESQEATAGWDEQLAAGNITLEQHAILVNQSATAYESLLAHLHDSAGETEQLYQRMGETVERQMLIARSAFQELMLSLFDTYASDLQELFRTITDVITLTIGVLQRDSAGFTNSLGGGLQYIIDLLENNKNKMAVSFVMMLDAVAKVGSWLLRIIPLLEMISALVAAAFAASVVYSFTGAIVMLIPVLGSATAMMTTFAVAVNAATGGLPALIAAVVAGIAALGAWVFVSDKASHAADQLKRETEALTEAMEDLNKQRTMDVSGPLAQTKEWILEQREAAAATGGLSAELQREYDHLEALTEQQALAAKAAGQLVEIDGKLTSVNAVLIDQGIEQGQETLAQVLVEQGEAAETAADRYASLSYGIDRIVAGEEKATTGKSRWNSAMERQVLNLYEGADSYVTLIAMQKASKEAMQLEVAEYDNLDLSIRKVVASRKGELSAAEQIAVLREDEKKRGEAEKAYAKILADRIKSEEAIGKLLRELHVEYLEANEFEVAVHRTKIEERERQIRTMFDEERALYVGQSDKIEEIALKETEAIATMRLSEARVLQQELDAMIQEARDETRDKFKSEIALAEAANSKELELAREKQKALLETYEIGSEARALVEDQSNKSLVDLETQHIDEIASIRRVGRHETDAEINAMAFENKQASIDKTEQIEQAHLKWIADHEEATEWQKFRVGTMFWKMKEDRHAEIEASIADETKKNLTKVERIQKKHDQWLLENADATEKQKAEIAEYYADEIKDVRREAIGDVVKTMIKAVGAIANVVGAAIDGLKSMVDFISNAIGKLGELVTAITGIDTSVGDLVGELGAGAVTAAEAGEQFDAQAFAEEMINTLLANAAAFTQALLEGLPTLLTEIANAIPVILQQVAAALPEIMSTIAEMLPEIVQAFADNIQPIITALAEGLPDIVDAIVEALPVIVAALGEALPVVIDVLIAEVPKLIEAILAALPDVITMITDAVVSIIDSLPELITMILEMLPDIITSLLESVDLIIAALLEAIPEIIFGLLESLPEIVASLAEGLYGIVAMLVEQIPILIAGIIDMIPVLLESLILMIMELVMAFIEAIPQIMMGLVRSLPVLLVSLIKLIPTLIIALIKGLVTAIPAILEVLWKELIQGFPELCKEMWNAGMAALKQGFQEIVEKFKAIFKEALGWFGDVFGKDEEGRRWWGRQWDKVVDWVMPQNAYSGVDYVPATMRMTVHKGEAVVPANRNPMNPASTSQDPALAGGYSSGRGGGGTTMDIAIMAEGRVLDAIQVTAMERGHAPKMTRQLKRQSGVSVGFQRGRFSAWSKS